MGWTKEAAIKGEKVGCGNCGGNRQVYPLNAMFAVGFGESGVTRDGETVWSESGEKRSFPTLQTFEDMAAADPDHDWRMFRYGPLREAEYQRHGPGAWVLIKEGDGFA